MMLSRQLIRRNSTLLLQVLRQYWCHSDWPKQLIISLLLAIAVDALLFYAWSVKNKPLPTPPLTASKPAACSHPALPITRQDLSATFWQTVTPLLAQDQLRLTHWQRITTAPLLGTVQSASQAWQFTFISSYPHFINFLTHLLSALPSLQIKQLTLQATAQGVQIETLFQLAIAATPSATHCSSVADAEQLRH